MVNLIDGRSLAQRIADAKELLVEHGYVVRGPLISKYAVKTPAQLVRFFYDTMSQYNPQFKMIYAGNIQRDRAIAKRLIEARIESGCSKNRAIAECCELITLLFKYEHVLGLSFAITSMGVLGQDSMGWVTEKLWGIFEGVNRAANADDEARWFSRLYAEQEKKNALDEETLLAARNHMNEVLKQHGKKEAK